MASNAVLHRTARTNRLSRFAIILSAGIVLSFLAWQAITAAGSPNPLAPGTSHFSAIIDIGVLVFREGLECILVLAAITASMTGTQEAQRVPVAAGAGVGLGATLITWFVVVRVLDDIGTNLSALNLQAITGLLAIVVLLIVMNWFFHKMYWTGWISLHNKKKRDLVEGKGRNVRKNLFVGLALLGFSSLYREGFEVDLFLQSYRLKLGGEVVLYGVLVGLFLSAVVAVLTFVAHRKLPYRKMLVATGVMLGVVLLVMVGEQVQEMQLAHWLPSHQIAWLAPHIPDWMGVWFSLFPNVESITGQAIAFLLVIGSYCLAASPKGSRASAKS
jgi:high-affinity iron transporter